MADRILVVVLFCGFALGAEDTGYPAGLMADCPGMNRSTTLSVVTQRSLTVVAMRPSSEIFGSEKKCRLSEDGASCVSKFLDLTNRKTVVLISGYMDASFSPLVRGMAGVYLARGRNVVVLEIFPVLVRTYPIAARVTKPLGKLLGEFLVELTRRGLSPSRLELIGGSLGAHIASFAAVRYHALTGRKPARLTGLDPAGPCFRNLPPAERFSADAAVKTDALHTNIDGFGIADAVAQVDFYANGGEYQPSIAGDFILPCFLLCSHVRAAYYWMLAFNNPEQFLAARCNSVADARHGNCYRHHVTSNLLGPKTNFSQPGVYYLPTNAMIPFFIGQDGLKKRDYGVNEYLLKSAPDHDLTV